jgi:hypothetical protein
MGSGFVVVPHDVGQEKMLAMPAVAFRAFFATAIVPTTASHFGK